MREKYNNKDKQASRDLIFTIHDELFNQSVADRKGLFIELFNEPYSIENLLNEKLMPEQIFAINHGQDKKGYHLPHRSYEQFEYDEYVKYIKRSYFPDKSISFVKSGLRDFIYNFMFFNIKNMSNCNYFSKLPISVINGDICCQFEKAAKFTEEIFHAIAIYCLLFRTDFIFVLTYMEKGQSNQYGHIGQFYDELNKRFPEWNEYWSVAGTNLYPGNGGKRSMMRQIFFTPKKPAPVEIKKYSFIKENTSKMSHWKIRLNKIIKSL